MNPPVRPGDSVFELGVGVGATLKAIRKLVPSIRPAGCDISANAIEVAIGIFPEAADAFTVADMAGRGCSAAADASQDHVVSFGALAMYLSYSEMGLALREARRIAKPSASLAFTHFLGTGEPLGTILTRVSEAEVEELATRVGLIDIKFSGMVHQGDRCAVLAPHLPAPQPLQPCFTARRSIIHDRFMMVCRAPGSSPGVPEGNVGRGRGSGRLNARDAARDAPSPRPRERLAARRPLLNSTSARSSRSRAG